MNNFFFSNLYPILRLQISLFFRNKQENQENGKRKEWISGFVELQRSKIFVAPGFNPGEMENGENRPRNNMEQNVNLLSDETVTGFMQEVSSENDYQENLDSKIRKTKN